MIVRNDETPEIVGYVTEPFMAPFVLFTPDHIFPLNAFHVTSIALPAPSLLERYDRILKANFTPQDVETETEGEDLLDAEVKIH